MLPPESDPIAWETCLLALLLPVAWESCKLEERHNKNSSETLKITVLAIPAPWSLPLSSSAQVPESQAE